MPFDFPLLDDSELQVWHYDDQTDPENPTLELMDIGTDYTVSISVDDEGGEITLTSASEDDHTYILLRASVDKQPLNIPLTESRLNVKNIEAELDRLALIEQEHKLEIRQSLKFSVASAILDVSVDDPIDDHVLLWKEVTPGVFKVVNSDRTWSGLLTYIDAAVAEAQGYATAAGNSAANAAASESAAAGSAAAAAASAAAAAASATTANTAAGNAAASAAAAQTSENNAATSEANAAASEAAAAASAAAAAASAASVAMNVFATQTIANGGTVNHTNANRQMRPTVSNGGEVVLSFTPFGNNPANFVGGMEITVEGTSDVNYVRIVPADIQYGILDPRGAILLKRGVSITYRYDAVGERWISKGRNT